MIVRWSGGTLLADRAALQMMYGVSLSTVRRHCRPCGRDRRTGAALYDAHAAADDLEHVLPRPERTAAAARVRAAAATTDSSR